LGGTEVPCTSSYKELKGARNHSWEDRALYVIMIIFPLLENKRENTHGIIKFDQKKWRHAYYEFKTCSRSAAGSGWSLEKSIFLCFWKLINASN
jgi:hypothetical protein